MNARPEPELMDRELPPVDVGTLIAINRAEIDGQIATAHAFPRSLTKFMREATELVTYNEDMAQACIYALPRDGKTIAGPSARFAEIIQNTFGNNRGGARVVAEDDQFVTAQGVYHDLEKNVQVTMEVKRRITDKYGKKYKPDMVGVTGNAAASIAHRNAVLKGIPKALWLPIYEAARLVGVGDVTTLVDRRAKAMTWFQSVGVTPEMILAKFQLEGVNDIGLEHLEVLTGLRTAIREGLSPESAFEPDVEMTTPAPTSKDAVKGMAEKLAGRKGKKVDAAADPAKDEDPTAQAVHEAIAAATDVDKLDEAADLIRALPEVDRPALTELYVKRRDELSAT